MQILSQIDQNTTLKDAYLAFKSLLSFSSKSHLEAKKELKTAIQDHFNTNVTLFDSGRTGLHIGLLALKNLQPTKNEVIVLGYTCLVVVNAILKAGLKPVFVDIKATNLNYRFISLRSKINSNTLAVVIQNSFGIIENYTKILELRQLHDFFLIEDLAHSMGNTYESELLGTMSDFAMLSFGSGKIISASRGGAILTQNKKIHKFISKYSQTLNLENDRQVKKHLFKIFSFYFCSKFYFYGGKYVLAILAKLGFFPLIMTPAEKNVDLKDIMLFNYPPQLAIVALNQFKNLTQIIEHRKLIANTYHQLLSTNKNKSITQFDYQNTSLIGYPILVPKPKKLYKSLFARKIQLNLEWSFNNIVPKDINYKRSLYIPASCKNAEQISKKIVYLPIHAQITIAKVNKLVKKLNKFL